MTKKYIKEEVVKLLTGYGEIKSLQSELTSCCDPRQRYSLALHLLRNLTQFKLSAPKELQDTLE